MLRRMIGRRPRSHCDNVEWSIPRCRANARREDLRIARAAAGKLRLEEEPETRLRRRLGNGQRALHVAMLIHTRGQRSLPPGESGALRLPQKTVHVMK